MLDEDPIGTYQPGDLLPGGVLAWEQLGIGQRCETWLAWSSEHWCPVVAKFPRPHQLDHPRARRALCREARALERNPHPALPRLMADATGAQVPALLLEYVDGVTLGDAIDGGARLDAGDAASLGAQVLAALRAVHRRGLAHVDIKPDNIMLRDGRPVLIDFGSARALGAPQPAGRPIGSPGYAAPDLEAGEPISAAMDMFGLGVTLYEALSGCAAFDPDDDAAGRPAPRPLPPSALAELVARLMAPDPADRPDLETTVRELGATAAAAGTPVWPDWAARNLSR